MINYRVVIQLQEVETMGDVKAVDTFHLSGRLGGYDAKMTEYNFFTRLCGAWVRKEG